MLLNITNFLCCESRTKWNIFANTWQVENTVWYLCKNIRFFNYISPLKKGNTLPKHFPFEQRLHVAKTFPPQRKATRCQNISPSNKGCTLPKHFPLKERLHLPETFPPRTKATRAQNISPSNKGYTFSKTFPCEREATRSRNISPTFTNILPITKRVGDEETSPVEKNRDDQDPPTE